MPRIKSENMCRVSTYETPGAGGFVGLVPPVTGMTTHLGVILDAGDSGVVTYGAGDGTYEKKAYPHELIVYSGEAVDYGWPDASGVRWGHGYLWPSGEEVPATNDVFAYQDGSDVVQTSTY